MKFLIVHLESFERFILMTPIFHELKKIYSDCEIDLISETKIPDEYLEAINTNYIFPKTFLKQYSFIRSLETYDIFIDVQRTEFKRFRGFIPFLKSDKKIGYNKPDKKRPFNFPLSKTKEKHLIDYYFKVFDVLSLSRPDRIVQLPNGGDKQIDVNSELKKILIYLTNDGWDEKLWFQFITNHNLSMFKIFIMLPESKLNLKQIIEARLDSVTVIDGYNVDTAINSMERMDYLITEDTILKYYASKTNIPVLQLAGSYLTELEYPLSKEYYVVKPKELNASVNKVAFDSVLLALREMTVKF